MVLSRVPDILHITCFNIYCQLPLEMFSFCFSARLPGLSHLVVNGILGIKLDLPIAIMGDISQPWLIRFSDVYLLLLVIEIAHF